MEVLPHIFSTFYGADKLAFGVGLDERCIPKLTVHRNVAQTSSLLYRRLPAGRAWDNLNV